MKVNTSAVNHLVEPGARPWPTLGRDIKLITPSNDKNQIEIGDLQTSFHADCTE